MQEFLDMPKPNGINIELTPTQYDYLYEVIMFAYEMEVPEPVSYTHLTLPTTPYV